MLRIRVRKNQNILRPSTRRDLSISAKKSRFPDSFKKFFGHKVAHFGIFSLGDVEHPNESWPAIPLTIVIGVFIIAIPKPSNDFN